MKKLTREIIEEHYSLINETSELKEIFQKVLVYFLDFHHFKNKAKENDTLFCGIHNNFSKEHHNCVACNLNDANRRIEEFLLNYRLFSDNFSVFSNFIFLLYLQVEYFLEYLNIIQIPEKYKQKNFHLLYTIKRWGNFLKHPKAFILVHHPVWEYESENYNIDKSKITIDNKFVNTYFAGESKNNDLRKQLKGKENITVLFPNPYKMIVDFCAVQKEFIELIAKNKLVIDILNDEATLTNYLVRLDEKESKKEKENL
jgi:hypothetical protein